MHAAGGLEDGGDETLNYDGESSGGGGGALGGGEASGGGGASGAASAAPSATASPAGGGAAPAGESEGDAPVRLVYLSSQILISLMAGPQLHAPFRASGGQVSSFQGRARPVHLPLCQQLLQQAMERRPTVRVTRLSARESRLLLQKS